MSLLRKIAFPFSLLYALVVCVRNWLFDSGILTSKQFRTPTICVGNISVGGTGKTPMIEYLIQALGEEYKVAVLSRGYKRKSKGFLLASRNSTVEEIGDEPFQIHRKFSKVSVAVDADRQNGILQLEKEVKPDVILMDDAFQHRRVRADLNILLTSYGRLYPDDWYLPSGNLRDSKSQARRADYIIVTKCPIDMPLKEGQAIKERLGTKKAQKVLFSALHYNDELKSDNGNLVLNSLGGVPFTLVTGIAEPKPLVKYLKNQNLLFNHLAFKDHHFFTPREIKDLNSRGTIVTTEKDFVRLKGKVENLFYIAVRHIFLNDGEGELKKELRVFMKRYS